MDGFLPLLRGDLQLGARVVRVEPSAHRVLLDDESSYTYDKLVSTMPLPSLIRLMGREAPAKVQRAAGKLRHVSVRCVNLGVARENLTDKHWIYYPEDGVFHRIFVQGNASPQNNAPGGFALTCEITYSPHKPLPCDGDALIERCIADCIAVGILRPDDRIIARSQVDMPYAYVVYDHARAANVATVREWLATQDIELAGRYSEWEYYNSDHAFLAGRKAAERVTLALRARDSAAEKSIASKSILPFVPATTVPAQS
jgi:protoporphyrinogen oxidase